MDALSTTVDGFGGSIAISGEHSASVVCSTLPNDHDANSVVAGNGNPIYNSALPNCTSGSIGPISNNATQDALEQKIVIGFFLSSMILLAILGNVLVCVAVLTDRYLKKINNLFYVSLAVSDLLLAILVMTPALVNDVLGYWVFASEFCYIWISLDVMCSTSSILNLCAISLDRYIHIRNPYRYEQMMTLPRIWLMIGVVWVTSLLISLLPVNLGWHTLPGTNFSISVIPINNETNLPICSLDFNVYFAVVSSLVSFYIPCIVMLILYFQLFAFARKHAKEIRKLQKFECFGPGMGPNNNKKSKGSKVSDNKAAFTLGIIMGVFLFCWVPFFVFNVIHAFCKCIHPIAFGALTWLGYLNSCMNPIIYSIFNVDFRRAFKKILCSNRMCKMDTKMRIFCFKEIKQKSVGLRSSTPMINRKVMQTRNGHRNGATFCVSSADDSTLPLQSNGSTERITTV